ncbi:hypothetical protein ACQQ6W_08365 [Lysinibacillus fusiformis]
MSGTSRVTDRVRESQRVTDRGKEVTDRGRKVTDRKGKVTDRERKVMDTHEEGAGGEAKMRESQRVTDTPARFLLLVHLSLLHYSRLIKLT